MAQEQQLYTESYIKAELNEEMHDGIKTVGDCIKHFAEVRGDVEAFIFASLKGKEHRTAVTWSTLYEKAVKVAKALIAFGIKQDELLAINLRPCPEWLYLAFGAVLAGVKVVGVSFTYTDGRDVIALMERLGKCSILALDPGVDGQNKRILEGLIDKFTDDGQVISEKLPSLRHIIGYAFSGHTTSLKHKTMDELIANVDEMIELPVLDPDDVIALFPTSGSTGMPKFVAHTNHNFLNIRRFVTKMNVLPENLKLFNDRPFNWAGGTPLASMLGQPRVTMNGFDDVEVEDPIRRRIEVIAEEGCTQVIVLPPRLAEFLHYQDELPAEWSVTMMLTGGQPLTRNIVKAIGKLCKVVFCSYGATEAILVSQQVVMDPQQFIEFSCGKGWPGSGQEIKIVNEAGEIVPVNTKGEIYVKSPAMFKEYFNDPEKTARVFTADGWYKTDDFGRITDDGHLYIEGRKSNMIISGGINVSPEILETVLKSCPGVEEAVIVPVPDDVYYQVLCACVVVKPGCKVDEVELREYCKMIHNDKPGLFIVLPKFYMFMDSLPTLSTGKVARKELIVIAKEKYGQTTK